MSPVSPDVTTNDSPDEPDALPPDDRVPGEAAVWAAGCALAAAAALTSGGLAVTYFTEALNLNRWGSSGSRYRAGGAGFWVPLAGLVLFAGWLGWRARGRIAEVRRWCGPAGRRLAISAAIFAAVAVYETIWGNDWAVGAAVFFLLLIGPAVGCGLLTWTAAACGPVVFRRPLAQAAGWVAGCVGGGLLAFGPAVWQTLRTAPAVGYDPLIVGAGGVLTVFVAALTGAVVWLRDPDAHDRLARWGQVGAAGFAATAALIAPLLARLFAETASAGREPALFFTAFLVLPAAGCFVLALAGRWAGRQAGTDRTP